MAWEYKTVVIENHSNVYDLTGPKDFNVAGTDLVLNSMAKEKWELTNVSNVLANGNTIQMVYYFKRLIIVSHSSIPDIGYDVDNNGITGSQS